MTLTVFDIIKRIKKKEFIVTYEEAIELGALMDVHYTWLYSATGKPQLVSIEIPMFSDLKMSVLQ